MDWAGLRPMRRTQRLALSLPTNTDQRALILVVEDDVELLTMLAFNLERHGFRVAQAADGATGLQLTRQIKPDLVLLDLMLPQLDGRQVCRSIRADAPIAQTPILILTALDREIDIVNGL